MGEHLEEQQKKKVAKSRDIHVHKFDASAITKL